MLVLRVNLFGRRCVEDVNGEPRRRKGHGLSKESRGNGSRYRYFMMVQFRNSASDFVWRFH
jgi:hypothetical protein